MAKSLSLNEGRVLNVIPRTNERPMRINDIAELLKLERRSVQSIIETLISDYGVPIVSLRSGSYEHKGVYIATSDEEREIGLVSLRSQVLENTKRIKAVEDADLKNWQDNILIQTELVNLTDENTKENNDEAI